jgi:hypothetical protein
MSDLYREICKQVLKLENDVLLLESLSEFGLFSCLFTFLSKDDILYPL